MTVLFMTLMLAAATAAPSSTATPAPHNGASFADAIVINAPNEDAGVGSEYIWLAKHPCSGGTWRPAQQALIFHDKVPYDVLTVTCSNGGEQRIFYFNIAGYFGKA